MRLNPRVINDVRAKQTQQHLFKGGKTAKKRAVLGVVDLFVVPLLVVFTCITWVVAGWDSNPQHPSLKANALPAELPGQVSMAV